MKDKKSLCLKAKYQRYEIYGFEFYMKSLEVLELCWYECMVAVCLFGTVLLE